LPRSPRAVKGLVAAPADLFAVLSLLLVMLIWGSTFVVTKAAVADVPPFTLAFLRFALASAILVPLAWARRGFDGLPRPLPLGTLALMGLSGVTIFFAGFNLALSYTTATEGALIQGTIPAVSALAAALVLKERLSRARAIGIGASMLGVALVVLAGGGASTAPNRVVGDLVMMATIVAWAAYSMLGRRLRAASGLAISAYSTLLGTVFLAPAAAGELLLRPSWSVPLEAWLAVAYLGVVASALAFWLWNRALRVLDVGQASAFINLVPLIGVASSALALGEQLTPSHLLGGVLIVIGIGLSLR
jgi:drug/metabolite transporter (DMT)-like permease